MIRVIISLLLLAIPADAAVQWAKQYGGTLRDSIFCLAVDASGNLIAAGRFNGTANFGGSSLVSAGQTDIVLAKYDRVGNHIWSVRYGGTGEDLVRGLALDSSGNIFICGQFSGQTDLGGGALNSAGLTDIFVAKYSPLGAFVWGNRFGDFSDDAAEAIAIDHSNNVLMTGFFKANVNFGGGVMSSAFTGLDAFVVKFSNSGTHMFSTNFVSDADDEGTGVAIDGSDNIILTGHTLGTMNFGGGNLSNAGARDFYLAKLNSSGVHVWSHMYGGTTTDKSVAVAVDSSDNIFLLGLFSTSINVGGSTFTTAGSSDSDVLLAKFASDSTHLWSHSFPGPAAEFPTGMAVGPTGNVAITGYFPNTINLGGGVLTTPSSGNNDAFVAKYSGAGTHIFSLQLGGIPADFGYAVVLDGNDEFISSGEFGGSATFGSQSFTSFGSTDAFLVGSRTGSQVPRNLKLRNIALRR